VSKELDLAEGKEYGGQLQDQHLRDDRLDMVMAIKGHGEKGNDPVSQELLAEVHGITKFIHMVSAANIASCLKIWKIYINMNSKDGKH